MVVLITVIINDNNSGQHLETPVLYRFLLTSPSKQPIFQVPWGSFPLCLRRHQVSERSSDFPQGAQLTNKDQGIEPQKDPTSQSLSLIENRVTVRLGDNHPLQRRIKLLLCWIYLKIEQTRSFQCWLVGWHGSRDRRRGWGVGAWWVAGVAVGSGQGEDILRCLNRVLEEHSRRWSQGCGEDALKVCG